MRARPPLTTHRAFALLFLLVACGDDTSPTAEAERRAQLSEGCLINSDCQDPLVCAFRRCHIQCSSSKDCPAGLSCRVADKPVNICQLPDEAAECAYNSDCPGAQVCASDARCRDQCATNRDCLASQLCTEAVCAEPADLVGGRLPQKLSAPPGTQGQSCVLSSDCAEGLFCLNKTCSVQCREDRDCLPGEHCDAGRCATTQGQGGAAGGAGSSQAGAPQAGDGGSSGTSGQNGGMGGTNTAGQAGQGGDAAGASGDGGGGISGTSGQGGVTQGGAGEGGESQGGDGGASGEGGASGGQGGAGGAVLQACIYSSECTPPEVCLAGFCRPQCVSDVDCPSGKVCQQGSCTAPAGSAPGYGDTCNLNSDCPQTPGFPPLLCGPSGQCVHECNGDADCNAIQGFCCVQNQCVTGVACKGNGGSGGAGGSAGAGGDGGAGGKIGEACLDALECDDFVFCNGQERCYAGKCAPALLGPCDSQSACVEDICFEDSKTCGHKNLSETGEDPDGDGHFDFLCKDGDDCDNSDPTVYTGAPEKCDGKDNDCNGKIDDYSRKPYGTMFANNVSHPNTPRGLLAPAGAGFIYFDSGVNGPGVRFLVAGSNGKTTGNPYVLSGSYTVEVQDAAGGPDAGALLYRADQNRNLAIVSATGALLLHTTLTTNATGLPDVVWTGSHFFVGSPSIEGGKTISNLLLYTPDGTASGGPGIIPTADGSGQLGGDLTIRVAATATTLGASFVDASDGLLKVAIFGLSGALIHPPVVVSPSPDATLLALGGSKAGFSVIWKDQSKAWATHVSNLGELGITKEIQGTEPVFGQGAGDGEGAAFLLRYSNGIRFAYARGDLSDGVELSSFFSNDVNLMALSMSPLGGPAAMSFFHAGAKQIRTLRVGCEPLRYGNSPAHFLWVTPLPPESISMTTLRPSLWLLLPLLLACGDDTSPSAEAERRAQLSEGCVLNSECSQDPSPLVCGFRRCHVECNSSVDCAKTPSGDQLRCMLSDKPTHVCQLDDEVKCTFNSDCPGDQVCGVDGECRDQCITERDCVKGQLCVRGTCAEPAELVNGDLLPAGQSSVAGQPCSYNSDCEEPLVCRAQGFCGLECKGDRDCAAGALCQNSRCVSPSSGPGGAGGSQGNAGAGGVSGASGQGGQGGGAGGVAGSSGAGGQGQGGSAGVSGQGGVSGSSGQGGQGGMSGASGQGGSGAAGGPEACSNGLLDAGESDVDCGGSCAPCPDGKACAFALDCASLVCFSKLCIPGNCGDGVKNGSETGVDCGGSCEPCAPGATCTAASDCGSGVCGSDSLCAAATCTDGVKNDDETDTDCGGSCAPCAAGATCVKDADCGSGSCGAGKCKASYKLTVTVAGAATGTVTSTPAGIDCNTGTCEATFLEGQKVTLAATPGTEAILGGWSGACSGKASCAVMMSKDQAVTATFNATTGGQTLAANKIGTIGGTSASVQIGGPFLSVFPSGALIVGGWFSQALSFGTGELKPNGTDGVVAVYDGGTQNTARWALKLGGAGTEQVHGVAAHPSGDVLVAATSTAAATDLFFGGPALSCSASSLILARYGGATGLHKWSRCVGSNLTIRRVLADGNGDLVVLADLVGSMTIGPDSYTSLGRDLVLAHVAAEDGAIKAIKHLKNTGDEQGYNLARSAVGGYALAASCSAALALPGGVSTTHHKGTDACVIVLDGALAPTSAVELGGDLDDAASALDFTAQGDLVVTGTFQDQVFFVPNQGVISKGNEDIFLAQLDKGTLATQWYKVFGGKSPDLVQQIVAASDGNLFLAGKLTGGGGSGGFSFGGPTMATSIEAFVVGLDSAGGHRWTRALDGTNSVSVASLLLAPSGALLLGASSSLSNFGFGCESCAVTLAP